MNLRVFYLTRRGISDGYLAALPVTKAKMPEKRKVKSFPRHLRLFLLCL